MKGKIVRWYTYRGFGFIDVEEKDKDIFLHTNDIQESSSPKIGDMVDFEVQESHKGPRAINVKIE